MSEVKRYEAVHIRHEESNIRYGEGCEVEVVAAYDYDTLRTANQRLEIEVKRLRESLIEVTASLEWNAHGICRGVTEGPIMPSAMAVAFAKAALSTNDEVTK